jgi:hypothetical protein
VTRPPLVCSPASPCGYHADGGSKRVKCAGYCDRRGCRELATTEVGPRGLALCDAHANPRSVGHPISTGSKGLRVVAFRLSASDRVRAEAAATRARLTVGELARRALLERLG